MDKEKRRYLAQIGKLDQVIHSPARLMIIKILSDMDKIDCVLLSTLTELSWGNLSSHLNKLEETGYVRMEKSWLGKKPNTSVQLTELGARAFQEWGRQIMSALPSQMNPDVLFDNRNKEDFPLPVEFENKTESGSINTQILWFKPTDNRWENMLPPIESLSQQV